MGSIEEPRTSPETRHLVESHCKENLEIVQHSEKLLATVKDIHADILDMQNLSDAGKQIPDARHNALRKEFEQADAAVDQLNALVERRERRKWLTALRGAESSMRALLDQTAYQIEMR